MTHKQLNNLQAADILRLQNTLIHDPIHPHIHTADMPFRVTSTWQDHNCQFSIWEENDQILAWAVFQPAWWNLDCWVHPSQKGSLMEKELIEWGVEQMKSYRQRTGETFWGSVEFFEDEKSEAQTAGLLLDLGFKKFEWSTVRLAHNLSADAVPSNPETPKPFSVRPLRGSAEVEAYVDLHRAAFGSDKMTAAWRKRTLQHPAYRPELDLVIADADDRPVGFCICWLSGTLGHIEPLGVHPDYQGLGLGMALEQAAVATLHQHGAQTVFIDHTSFNETAIALSQKNGFKQVNNALRYYVEID